MRESKNTDDEYMLADSLMIMPERKRLFPCLSCFISKGLVLLLVQFNLHIPTMRRMHLGLTFCICNTSIEKEHKG